MFIALRRAATYRSCRRVLSAGSSSPSPGWWKWDDRESTGDPDSPWRVRMYGCLSSRSWFVTETEDEDVEYRYMPGLSASDQEILFANVKLSRRLASCSSCSGSLDISITS